MIRIRDYFEMMMMIAMSLYLWYLTRNESSSVNRYILNAGFPGDYQITMIFVFYTSVNN
jgi:hypothetical protein